MREWARFLVRVGIKISANKGCGGWEASACKEALAVRGIIENEVWGGR